MKQDQNFNSDILLSLADAWVKSRQRIEEADVINRRILLQTLSDKSFWLAPKPLAFYILFSLMFILGLSYCIVVNPGYWPVPALCIFGGADMAWQSDLRDKIRRIDGGIIGLQKNLLLYRRLYIWLSVAMWVIMIPFLWWFGSFNNLYSEPVNAIICLTLLLAACVTVFIIRTRKTFRALGDLQSLTSELHDLKQ